MNCDHCGKVFAAGINAKPHRCRFCGAGAHWARGADSDRWALNTSADRECFWIKRGGRPRPAFLPRDELNAAPNPFWVGFGNAHLQHQSNCAFRRERPCDCEPTINKKDQTRWRKIELRADPYVDNGFHDIDGTWLWADEMMGVPENFGRKAGVGVNDTTSTRYAQNLGRPTTTDYLATRDDWYISREATTGRQTGRPAEGITDRATIDALFRVAANTTLGLVAFRPCVRINGRPTARLQETRTQLARGVFGARQQRANAEAMADMLGCDRRAIYRLEEAGQKVSQNCPNEEEQTMIATDEQVAVDAEWLRSTAFLLALMAERLIGRFPKDSEVQIAIDKFLHQVGNTEGPAVGWPEAA